MRFGAKCAFCYRDLNINGHIETQLHKMNVEVTTFSSSLAKNVIKSPLVFGAVTYGVTAKYAIDRCAFGTRFGRTHSSVETTSFLQVTADVSSNRCQFRPGFVPGACPAFDFENDSGDRVGAGGDMVAERPGERVMMIGVARPDENGERIGGRVGSRGDGGEDATSSCMVSVNGAVELRRGWELTGALTLYDSRLSSTPPEENWSLALVCKKLRNVAFALVGNAKKFVGLGFSLDITGMAIRGGIYTDWENLRDLDNFSPERLQYSMGIEIPSVPQDITTWQEYVQILEDEISKLS